MLVFALAATRFFAPAVVERTKGSSPAQSSSRSLAGCAGREQPHHVPRAPGRRTGTAAAPARPPRCCPHPRRAAGLLNTKVPKVLATETNPFPASFPILPFPQTVLVAGNACDTSKIRKPGVSAGWADWDCWLLFSNFVQVLPKVDYIIAYRKKLEGLTSVPKICITDFMLSSNAELVILLVSSHFQGTLIGTLVLFLLESVAFAGPVSGPLPWFGVTVLP